MTNGNGNGTGQRERAQVLVGELLAGACEREPDWADYGAYGAALKPLWPVLQDRGLREAQRVYGRMERVVDGLVGLKTDLEVTEPDDLTLTPELLRELDHYPTTDTGQAEVLAHLYAGKILFVPGLGWLIWTGQRWKPDDLRAIPNYARQAARARLQAVVAREVPEGNAAEEKRWAADARWAKQAENSRPKANALHEAEAEPELKADIGVLDAHDHLLGVGNGVLDLRTGQVRPGLPSDMMTQRTSVPYYPAAKAPRWDRFLQEVFDGDAELIAYIQRAAGYSLTGATSEQCFFQCYGTGANGKSTLLNTLKSVGGDYARTTPFTTFDANQRSTATNDLAALRAARLVLSSETGDNTRLNEERIKAVTGGEDITARFLYQETITYRPRFKLWFASNHKPVVRGTDDGIWRRVRLIPFAVSFKGRADKDLEDDLGAELPGILSWAVRGALEWYDAGSLNEPRAVLLATEEYRAESDVLGYFLSECTVSAPGRVVRARQLYEAYKTWAEENSIKPLSGVVFGKRMAERGTEQKRTKYGNEWIGLGLLRDRSEDDDPDEEGETAPLLL